MVTVVLCGGSTLTLLTWFDIPLGVEDDEDRAPLSGTASPNHNYRFVQCCQFFLSQLELL